MITINGIAREDVTGITVGEYLMKQNYQISRVAVERNGEILPKSLYHSTQMIEGDIFEIVSFVGGG